MTVSLPRKVALFGLGTVLGTALVRSARHLVSDARRSTARRVDVLDEIERLEMRFAAAQTIGRVGTWELDLATNALWWSHEVFRICGLEPGSCQPTAERFLDRVHPDDRERLREAIERTRTARHTIAIDFRIIRPDGSVRHVERRGAAEYDAAGKPIRLLGTLRDITERKRYEARRHESDARYRLLFERNPMPLFLLDAETTGFLAVNEAAVRTYGYTRDEFRAMTALEIRPAEEIERMLRGGSNDDGYRRMEGRWRHLRKDGSILDVAVARHQFRLGGRSVQLVLAVDITDQVRAEDALHRSRAELEQFADRLQKAVEEERARIAREIHDELGQALTGLRMQAAGLESHVAGNPEAVAAIATMSTLIDGTVQTVRRIATELRPGVLDAFGVVHAIEWAVQDMAQRARIEARFENRLPFEPNLGEDRDTQVFRVVQEALTNVARHARARRVEVDLRAEDGALEVRVSDNGVGFDVARVRFTESLGLLGMRERARLMGALLDVRSAPGRGTRIRLRIPDVAPSETS